jgi:hypothetical protein
MHPVGWGLVGRRRKSSDYTRRGRHGDVAGRGFDPRRLHLGPTCRKRQVGLFSWETHIQGVLRTTRGRDRTTIRQDALFLDLCHRRPLPCVGLDLDRSLARIARHRGSVCEGDLKGIAVCCWCKFTGSSEIPLPWRECCLTISPQGANQARPAGFEPATNGLEIRCSIP